MAQAYTVLVTGGAGYIGSHTVHELLKSSWVEQVVVYDNLSTGFAEAIPPWAVLVQGDILDTEKLKNTLKQYQVRAVIHFAAKLIVPESMREPLLYYENNVYGVISTLKACQATGVKEFIFSSTAAVYGEQDTTEKIREQALCQPANPYGFSKWMSEQIIRDQHPAWGLRSIVLRYFNVAGAQVDGSNGQRTKAATHLIKVAAEAACGKRPYVQVFGQDYPTPDGSGIRDYIHVTDLADIHVRSLEYLWQHPSFAHETFNCGYGKGYSVWEVLRCMQKVSGTPFEIQPAPRRPGDVAQLIANPSRLQELLQWQARYDDLSLICRTAWEWEKKLP